MLLEWMSSKDVFFLVMTLRHYWETACDVENGVGEDILHLPFAAFVNDGGGAPN